MPLRRRPRWLIKSFQRVPTAARCVRTGSMMSSPQLFHSQGGVSSAKQTGIYSRAICAFPTSAEIQACWELCRLHNNIGFWVVWLPTGKCHVYSQRKCHSNMHAPYPAWSISMAYHAQPQISATSALSRAATYIPLCFGIKSLVNQRLLACSCSSSGLMSSILTDNDY